MNLGKLEVVLRHAVDGAQCQEPRQKAHQVILHAQKVIGIPTDASKQAGKQVSKQGTNHLGALALAKQLCHVGQALVGLGDELSTDAVHRLDVHGLASIAVTGILACTQAREKGKQTEAGRQAKRGACHAKRGACNAYLVDLLLLVGLQPLFEQVLVVAVPACAKRDSVAAKPTAAKQSDVASKQASRASSSLPSSVGVDKDGNQAVAWNNGLQVLHHGGDLLTTGVQCCQCCFDPVLDLVMVFAVFGVVAQKFELKLDC